MASTKCSAPIIIPMRRSGRNRYTAKEEGVRFTIDSEIAERKKLKKSIPPPEKKTSFNGKILIRIEPVLHEKVFLEAKAAGKSVNGYIQEKLAKN